MIRVFPRRTKATPEDPLVFVSGPPHSRLECRDVVVSVTFTWDKSIGECLAEQWSNAGYNVRIGGPAYDDAGGEFVPGRYLQLGYVITSRGCNNHCWFCYVWKREGRIRELPIVEGWNVLDSNLLQCSQEHIIKVFEMLEIQAQRPVFTGGLESVYLKDWHIKWLKQIKTQRLYLAYDTPDDYEPLVVAAKKLCEARVCGAHDRCCYVLIGFSQDTFEAATSRLENVLKLGLTPMAMLYRDNRGDTQSEWRKFQRLWARPSIIYARYSKNFGNK